MTVESAFERGHFFFFFLVSSFHKPQKDFIGSMQMPFKFLFQNDFVSVDHWSKISNLLFFLQLIYAGIALFRKSDLVRSQAGLGISGVILVAITVAAGLGLSAFIGIPFNASTTQILPFLALGMGVNAMFLMTDTYAELLESTTIPEEVSLKVF